MQPKTLTSSVVAFLLAPISCLAWGVEGHQIIAHIAAHELTPAARSQVQGLLGASAERAMVEASTWADEVRPTRPSTAPWHFVNVPIGSRGYDALRQCPGGDCIVAQIERQTAVLADRRLLPAVRADGFRFLIYFVGDVHQPLHASNNNDRGGNELRVVSGRRVTNMHAVWDGDIVRAFNRDPEVVGAALERSIGPTDRRAWKTGAATDWANETFRIAASEIYDPLVGSGGTDAPVVLPANYAASKRTVVEAQLKKAGIRLAWILNQTLR